MKRTWTIIAVADVHKSFAWYQRLFGQPPGELFHPDFAQLLDDDGTVLPCLCETRARASSLCATPTGTA